MAKLSAHGTEVARFARRLPDSDDCTDRVITMVVMSDRVVLSKYGVKFRPDAYHPQGYRHDWGWTKVGRVRAGMVRTFVDARLRVSHTSQVGVSDFALVGE
jgi:hypothetical protein